MSEIHRPLSLAQHFDAPDGFMATFGWLCGYSADADFLNEAAERFTRQTDRQRMALGRIVLALMLDPRHPQLDLNATPGVLHMGLADPKEQPFRLLHAKVALLGFHNETDPGRWLLRLLVSTGNWTKETLEQSLDLVWRVDIENSQLQEPDEEALQIVCDIQEAWKFINWLRGYFNTGILDAVPQGREDTETLLYKSRFETWMGEVGNTKTAQSPRFIDNRKASFLDQLPGRIETNCQPGARKCLCMGSGFFQGGDGKGDVPSVLTAIVNKLQKNHLLTQSARKEVFVNPVACQAVAGSVQAMHDHRFRVWPAHQPDFFGPNKRSLHAKFLFSASVRSRSYYCYRPWLYLGSGNLTQPGFLQTASSSGGNLEAGVVFEPPDLYWPDDSGNAVEEPCVSNLLPLAWQNEITQGDDQISSGEKMPEPGPPYLAAPLAWVTWVKKNGTGYLELPEIPKCPVWIQVDPGGDWLTPDDQARIPGAGKRPLVVAVRWQADDGNHEQSVPVMDEFGRLAATELPPLNLEEAWWQLAEFPMPPEDNPDSPDGDPEDPSGPGGGTGGGPGSQLHVADYPVRRIMQLVENVAAKQTGVSDADWPVWCTRLEQSLIQVAESVVLQRLIEIGLNPLSPLWQKPFRPTFAEDALTPEGRRYEEALTRVEAKWELGDLQRIGE